MSSSHLKKKRTIRVVDPLKGLIQGPIDGDPNSIGVLNMVAKYEVSAPADLHIDCDFKDYWGSHWQRHRDGEIISTCQVDVSAEGHVFKTNGGIDINLANPDDAVKITCTFSGLDQWENSIAKFFMWFLTKKQ